MKVHHSLGRIGRAWMTRSGRRLALVKSKADFATKQRNLEFEGAMRTLPQIDEGNSLGKLLISAAALGALTYGLAFLPNFGQEDDPQLVQQPPEVTPVGPGTAPQDEAHDQMLNSQEQTLGNLQYYDRIENMKKPLVGTGFSISRSGANNGEPIQVGPSALQTHVSGGGYPAVPAGLGPPHHASMP